MAYISSLINRRRRTFKTKNNRRSSDETSNFARRFDFKGNIVHKRVIIGLAIVVVILIGYFAYNAYENSVVYDDFTVESSLNISDGAGSQYRAFQDFFVRYGLDGISYLDGDTTVWSQAYEMTNPIVDICEDYVAVADKGTNTIYVFDDEGLAGTVTTTYPIIKLEVANQGVVAALLEEDTANYIEVYDKNGDNLVTSKTLVNGNGYPLSFSLSNDGTKMIVSYVSISSGNMTSSLKFYNFSDVGMNETDRVVGGFNYDSTIFPQVEFLTNNKAVAVGDNKIVFFSMSEVPSQNEEITIEDKIDKVFYSEDYLGIAIKNSDAQDSYRVKAYNVNGSQVMDENIATDFENIEFTGKNILVYDDLNCKIVSFGGKTRFDYHFQEAVTSILPTDSFREYLMITNNNVRRIKIK